MGKYFESFDGAKIYYHKTEKNNKLWLILLHGLGGDLTSWHKERSHFTRSGISTIAMDLRGHGLSERRNVADFYKFENFAKDVATLIEKEGLKNVVVVGHCFGGMVSIYFQSQFPKLSKGLILVDTSYKPTFFGKNFISKGLLNKMITLLLKFASTEKVKGHEKPDLFIGSSDLDLKRILSDMLHTSLKSYLMMFDSLINLDAKAMLDKIKVPTLVIEGAEDTIFPPKLAEDLKSRIKNSELELIEGANHIIVINNPKQLEQSIEGFLRKLKFIP